MGTALRRTPATLDVLRVLSEAEDAIWGLQATRETGRPTGSVYPILTRLEAAGWVVSHWEVDRQQAGPRRRYYRLTDLGHREAARMLAPRGAVRGSSKVQPA
jgi:PadR family transcriptional regulator PadR